MKKIISFLLIIVFVFSLSACGSNSPKSIIGKWYNKKGNCLEILSDNTYQRQSLTQNDNYEVRESGEWKYLETEKFFKFTNNETKDFIKITIDKDKYGAYIEYGDYGVFYKNEYPKSLENKDKEETPSEIRCPKFLGMTEEQVKESEYNKIFNIIFEYEKNKDFPVNQICKQSKKEGEKLKKDAEITLTVSMGISICKVPDVYGKSESYAISQLKNDKFSYIIKEVFDDEVDAGLVVKTEPAKTTVVPEGTEITVYVSKGKAQE